MKHKDDSEHWARLENMYREAAINRLFEPRISVAEGRCEIQQDVLKEHFHGGGALHGSVLFKLLDDACYFASSSLIKDRFMVTSSFNIYFARPVSSGIVTTKAKVLFRSGQQIIAEASVFDDRSREVARGSGAFVRSRIHLAEKLGYRLPSHE